MDDVWADLPIDILYCVCKRFIFPKEIVSMSVVCKSWQSSINLLFEKIQISTNIPRLMLSQEDKYGGRSRSSSVRSFYDLSNGRMLNLELNDTIDRKCLSVGFGWLLIIDIKLRMDLFHPLTGRKINLPCYKYDHVYKVSELHHIHIVKAVVSANPWNSKIQDYNQDCVIMTSYGIGLPLFAKLGDKSWTNIHVPNKRYFDINCYKNMFYAVSETSLYVCTMDGHLVHSVQVDQLGRNILKHYVWRYPQKYLVESAGELLLVYRKFGGSFHDDDETSEIIYMTTSFEVVRCIHKFATNGKIDFDFVKVDTLDDQALFVGDNASLSLAATSLNGCREDCIYFTDDSNDFYAATKNGGGYDMGIYNLRDGTIEQHYKGEESLSYFNTPFWYI
ncbi:hypothetical protein ACFE04_013359 [Oxalis oulophora]